MNNSELIESNNRHYVETCTDKDEWNSFVENNGGPAYVLWGWSEAVASYGHERWNLVVRDRNTEEIRGALPIHYVNSWIFGKQLLSPAFAERGSIILDTEGPGEPKHLLLKQAKKMADDRDVDVASLRGSQVSDSDTFTEKKQYVTFQVSVERDTSKVWSDIKESRRRQIEQADTNSSLQFRVGDSLDDLREYYQLYLESMRGHGSPPHSFEFFKTIWNHLYPKNNFRLSMVLRDGSLINAMIDLSSGENVYQWGVITDYEYRDLNGGSLLLWKSLQWAAENGYDTYEFGRTREGSGVYMFKKSFGGSKEWYNDLHYFPNDTADLPDPEDDKYEQAKEVWQRLPLKFTRIVGPQIRKRIGL